ncbi:hypothetical protein J2129_001636 [Methanofollis sp. W23]|uniref:hypothetical protein n=1 Tax=Methanofollis sp. W23 TaxID=2817849 RepID=UPI001AEAF4AA|nr:hypothetical protein [Methanofollis sp. W23]MBP2146182.1 hypothetical protein [Methanofollis sp. W23]
MRVRNREWVAKEAAVVVLVFVLGVARVWVAPGALVGPAMPPLSPWVEGAAACAWGLLVPGALGLLVEERTRPGGAAVVAFVLPLIASSATAWAPPVSPFFLGGLGAGAALVFWTFWENRADRLSQAVSLEVLLGAAAVLVLVAVPLVRAPTSSLAWTAGFFVLAAGLTLWAIRPVRGSETFLLGPAGSGKTLLFLAMYTHMVREFSGQREEVIFAAGEGEEEEKMRIERLLSDLEDGLLPSPTGAADLGVYRLSGRRFQVAPVEFTFLDYAGRYAPPLSRSEYAGAVKQVAAAVKVEPRQVGDWIGRFEYLKQFREQYGGEVAGVMDAFVPACVHRHLERAGKVLFLIDGDHIVDFHQEGRRALTRLFGQYSRVMETLGRDRVYGFVVTKADRIYDLAEIDETSVGAARVEHALYDLLLEINTFNEIHNRARSVPVHFLAVSTDATLRPVGAGENNGEEERLRQLYPWRIGAVVKCGF